MDRATTVDLEPDTTLESAPRAFSISMLVSGIRCAITYLILPFVTPFLGLAPGVGPGLGIVVGLSAIAANVFSIRRFWRLRHPWRKPVTAIHVAVIIFMVVLIVLDLRQLLS